LYQHHLRTGPTGRMYKAKVVMWCDLWQQLPRTRPSSSGKCQRLPNL